MGVYVNIAVEGVPDRAIAERICGYAGVGINKVFELRGKGRLDKKINSFNISARFVPWLVLRDLDHDADCPPGLKMRLLPMPEKNMCFCIAVREIESWLMADMESFARFIGVHVKHIPQTPDAVDDPKRVVVQLAGRSKYSEIREGLVPDAGSLRKEGILYSSLLTSA